ncbi:MAG: hypothetical protein HY941_04700 [Gammaproteobacteria bacterium]|nr:hypothetical protein [Gammaproteobacteria bacterium]
MRKRWSPAALVLIAAALLLLATRGTPAAQPDTGRRLVLVASSRSTVAPLTTAEIRKLFLGIPLAQGERIVVPLRNQTDPVIYEVFLQKTLFMSGPMYERTLLTRLLRTKGARPQTFENETDLLHALQADPNAVTYMWARQAEAAPDLRILVELWRE